MSEQPVVAQPLRADERLRDAVADYMEAVAAYLDPDNQFTDSRLHHIEVAAVRVRAALAVEAVRPETDIDEAWNEAAAALPKRWLGPNLFAYYPKGWEATAHHEDETPGQGRTYRSTGACYGETPAEALHALAIELRRRATAT